MQSSKGVSSSLRFVRFLHKYTRSGIALAAISASAWAAQSTREQQQVANPFATPWLVASLSNQAASDTVVPAPATAPVREYFPTLSMSIMLVLQPEISVAGPAEVLPRFRNRDANGNAKLSGVGDASEKGNDASVRGDMSAGAANSGVGNPDGVSDVTGSSAGYPKNSKSSSANATASSNGLNSIATDAAGRPIFIKKKYDVGKIGDRGIGGGVNFYSLDKEILLGKELAEEVEQQSKLFHDAVINEYINRIGQNLVRNSDAQVPFTIKIIDNDEVNAFALPGGFFYVNTGLIMAAENEAELAGVMAHEIAHVAARHATKNQTKRDIWNIASIPLIFVGGPAAIAVRNFASLAVPMSFMKFSRDAEREADLLGIQYEYATGYDPSAMVNFFERLSAKEKHRKNFIARAFSSHPMNEDRVRRAQKEMDTMLPPNEEYLLTTSEFDEVKARLLKMTSFKKLEDFDPKHPTLRKSTGEKQ